MRKKLNKPPDRAPVLYENLFGSGIDQAVERLCRGINVVLEHVSALLDEADLLVEHERFARARFLVATADEELGKAHILVDATRLDGMAQRSAATALCKAFYNHIVKYAYTQVWRSRDCFTSLQDVARDFDTNLVKWWPAGDPESGEPDMPHETRIYREMKLYVDYSEYSGDWIVPRPDEFRDEFEALFRGVPHLREKSRRHLGAFEVLRDGGVLTSPPMQAFNAIWRAHWFSRPNSAADPMDSELLDLRHETANQLAGLSTCRPGVILDSPLCFWPCYELLIDPSAQSGNSQGKRRWQPGK